MAEDSDNKEYKGSGKATSGVGRAVLEGGVLAAVALGVASIFSKNVRGVTKAFGQMTSAGAKVAFNVAMTDQKGFEKAGEALGKAAKAAVGDGAKAAFITAGSAAAVGGLHGLYKGASNASQASQQHDDLRGELDTQKNFVQQLKQEREQATAPPKGPAK
jgi:hypothetical protein